MSRKPSVFEYFAVRISMIHAEPNPVTETGGRRGPEGENRSDATMSPPTIQTVQEHRHMPQAES